MSTQILVAGGAGYIGSHMVKMLNRRGCRTVVLDNLSNGHRDAVLAGEFVQCDLSDTATLEHLFKTYRFDAVMHFASSIQVGESMREPMLYYRNNLVNSLNLLDCMVRHNVRHLVFSSSAAVYGNPVQVPMDESHAKSPISPYGKSKWMIEQILEDYDRAYGLKFASLRYFNAAGADPDGEFGERHHPETHLIPLAIEAALGKRPFLEIYGDDYATPDGTCIRDYIHVQDLCEAHWLALQAIEKERQSHAFNLGNGHGFSVREVVDTVSRLAGHSVPIHITARRPGDPARLVANADLAKKQLGWRPQYQDLDSIVQHALNWAKKETCRT